MTLFIHRRFTRIGFHTTCLLILISMAMALASGCGSSNADAASTQSHFVRTPHPTFTPTPVTQTPTQPTTDGATVGGSQAGDMAPPVPPATELPAPAPPALPPEAAAPPIAVINTDLVNARTGPGTSFTIVTILGRGEQFDITGKDVSGSWWRVCCVKGEEAWVVNQFVDSDGAVDGVPVVDENSPPSAVAVQKAASAQAEQAAAAPPVAPATATTPTPTTAATEAPSAPPTGAQYEFNLVAQEQFPETNVVRVFLFVYSGNEGLEGYSLRVAKDGVELPVSGTSFGGRPGLTWPIADPRQRSQNLKVEFPGQSAAGVWEVQLVRSGAPVGAPVHFTLQANDPNRELYVRYERP